MTDNNNNSKKKARIDATAKNDDNVIKSPKAVAVAGINNILESLHPNVKTIISPLAMAYLNCRIREYNKKYEIVKLIKDPDFIPSSARVKFAPKCVKGAKELPEFKKLEDDCSEAIKKIQAELRSFTVRANDISAKVLQDEVIAKLAESLYAVASSMLIAKNDKTTSPHSCVAAILHNEERFASICARGDTLPRNQVIETYQRIKSTTLSLTVVPDNHIIEVQRLFSSLFVIPFEDYLRQSQNNEISLDLQKLQREIHTTKATEDTSMMLDDELPTDRLQLGELIRKEAAAVADKEIKQLRQQLNSLRQAKNLPTRRTARSASYKKQNTANETKPKDTKNKDTNKNNNKNPNGRQNQDQQADAAANATPAQKSNASKKNGRKKSRPKKNNSTTGSNN